MHNCTLSFRLSGPFAPNLTQVRMKPWRNLWNFHAKIFTALARMLKLSKHGNMNNQERERKR